MKKIKRETENKEEHSPHTPYKEKQEGERESHHHHADVRSPSANIPRAREAVGFVMPKSELERKAFVSTPPELSAFLGWCDMRRVADIKWAREWWEEMEYTRCWLNDANVTIVHWPKYFAKCYDRTHRYETKSNKGLITRKGAYKRLSGDDKTMFDAFWDAYPTRRRTEKDKCADLLMRILAESGTDKVSMFNRLMDGLDKWKQSYDWTKQSGEYVMMPYRWLFNECWDTPPQGGSPTERRHGVSQTANVKLSEDQIGW